MALRIVFCGTPAFAVPSLRHLIAQPDFRSRGVVTQPDRPRGRGQEIATSPVKDAALAAGVPVFQPEKIKSDAALDYFKRLAPDVVVIIAYGQIISQRLIDIPRLGWINLHASLLPKYRGAAPINWAIVNGEARTGLTTMQIDAGLDTGPMLLKYETEIGRDETAPELTARLAEAGAPLIVETLRGLDRGEITADAAGRFAGDVRAAAEKRRRPHRLVAECAENLQPHSRIASLARRVHVVSGQKLPDLGKAAQAGCGGRHARHHVADAGGWLARDLRRRHRPAD